MYEGLMNAASACFFLCYIPELYANYRNKNANLYNVPEKVIMLAGTGLAFSYAVVNDDTSLMVNYGPILTLDVVALLMRAYYVWRNRYAIELTSGEVDDSNSKQDCDQEAVKS